ncbi:member of major facilitator superfamily multidrug-resistance, DHA1 sub-family [Mycena floridula]|nr:member of major facilitator superfamily multidrug-resistance, DHA1 sub-family [Mycena floridula]
MESEPLLGRRRSTPLPISQLFILFWVQLAEPITSQVIYPFINKLVSELPITNGDEKLVGYYAGLIESLFFVTEALTVLQWSRWSDHVGRRPILLTGLFGLSLSMVGFGLSKSYWSLVVSRCLAGLLNGNVGVIKSMMGELTDSTNIAQGMALLPVVWSTGAIIGPLIGGSLSNPYERFPNTFGQYEFWKTYPYALPCFVAAAYIAISFLMAFFFLKETVRPSTASTEEADRPLPLREVITPRVIIAVVNYALLALLDIALRALQPLFYTLSIEHGGLDFSVAVVGLCLAAFGLFSGLYQAFAFAPVYNRFGTKPVFVAAMATFGPMFALFPLMNLSARRTGVNAITWTGLSIQIVLYVVMDMGFSCAMIYVRAAAPSPRSLGATNGLAQTSISVVRAIGPAASTSLFAVSLQYNLLGGNLVYFVLGGVSALSLIATVYLPKRIWEHSS